jgi:beta-lactamase regulating signal transducer with metallopeptidase domain
MSIQPPEARPQSNTALSSLRKLPHLDVLAMALLLCGSVVYWSLAAARILGFKRLLRDIRPAPADLRQRVSAVAQQLQLNRVPTVWLVPGRIPPMLWTLGGRARLLVPAELWPVLSDSQQTALITHELAHLKRKDHWIRWLNLAVTGIYWWHPVEAEEQCCDAWAVWASPQESRCYAAALLAALEFVSGGPTAGVAAAAAVISGRGHVSFLKRRMRMIVQARTPKALSWTGRLGVLSLAALILPLAPTWAQEADAPKPDGGRDAATVAKSDSTIVGIVEADLNNDGVPEKIIVRDRNQAEEARQQPKGEAAEDDDHRHSSDNPKGKDVADHVERLLKDLVDKLSKDLGPVGEEILKTLDNAAKEVSEVLDKEGIISKDLREALEKARDEIHEAFKEGSPLNKQAQEAADKAREDVKDAVEKAREDVREAVRQHTEAAREAAEAARDRLLSQAQPKDERSAADADSSAQSQPGEVEQARREVRQMEQQLRQAMRRLQAIERRDQRLSRSQRRGPGAAPAPAASPRPDAPPSPPEGPGVSAPPAPPSAPAPPTTPRPLLRRDGPPGSGPPLQNPRVERRLRDLEDKMDRLLKELESLKGDKKDTSKSDGEQKDGLFRSRPRGRQSLPVRSNVVS